MIKKFLLSIFFISLWSSQSVYAETASGTGTLSNKKMTHKKRVKKKKKSKKQSKQRAFKKKHKKATTISKKNRKIKKRVAPKRASQSVPKGITSGQDHYAELKLLAKKYAPLVILHESERYFPSTIDFFLNNCVLKDSSNDQIVVQKGDVSYKTLKKYNDKKYRLVPTGTVLDVYAGQKPRFDETLKKFLVEVPCYTNIFERKNGEVIFQYWFFYTFNGSIPEIVLEKQLKGQSSLKKIKSVGDHEGDWEHVDVCVSAPTATHERTIKWAFYARHVSKIPNPSSRLSKLRAQKRIRDLPVLGTDQAYYRPDELNFFEQTHPIVLSALFGHASYPKIPKIPVRPLDKVMPQEIKDKFLVLLNKGLDRVSDKGAHWRTWDNLSIVGLNGVPEAGSEWLEFLGDWGVRGPNGPYAKDSWRKAEHCRSLRITVDAFPVEKGTFKTKSFEVELLKHAQDQLVIQVDHPDAADCEITLFEGNKIFAEGLAGTGQPIVKPKTLDDLHVIVRPKSGFEEKFKDLSHVSVQVFSQENR